MIMPKLEDKALAGHVINKLFTQEGKLYLDATLPDGPRKLWVWDDIDENLNCVGFVNQGKEGEVLTLPHPKELHRIVLERSKANPKARVTASFPTDTHPTTLQIKVGKETFRSPIPEDWLKGVMIGQEEMVAKAFTCERALLATKWTRTESGIVRYNAILGSACAEAVVTHPRGTAEGKYRWAIGMWGANGSQRTQEEAQGLVDGLLRAGGYLLL